MSLSCVSSNVGKRVAVTCSHILSQELGLKNAWHCPKLEIQQPSKRYNSQFIMILRDFTCLSLWGCLYLYHVYVYIYIYIQYYNMICLLNSLVLYQWHSIVSTFFKITVTLGLRRLPPQAPLAPRLKWDHYHSSHFIYRNRPIYWMIYGLYMNYIQIYWLVVYLPL